MELRIFGRGFNYSQDGQGNRLVYHLKGCNMHCPWCSNPEGMSFDGKANAVTVEALVEEAIRSKPMFFGGGGVTFTGGEATAQAEALGVALKMLKENGIDTAIETNGTYKNLPDLLPYIDHLIIDLKHPDDPTCRAVTGVGCDCTKENIRNALSLGKDTLVRIPLINGFNNSPEAKRGFAEFFSSLEGNTLSVEVLKYHEYGRDKWQKLGLEYKMKDAFVTEDDRRSLEDMLEGIGITVVRT